MEHVQTLVKHATNLMEGNPPLSEREEAHDLSSVAQSLNSFWLQREVWHVGKVVSS